MLVNLRKYKILSFIHNCDENAIYSTGRNSEQQSYVFNGNKIVRDCQFPIPTINKPQKR